MTSIGLDVGALQVRDLDRAAAFYEERLGLTRAPRSPEGAVVLAAEPFPDPVREPLPGVNLEAAAPGVGVGVALWFHTEDVDRLHESLRRAAVPIVAPPAAGPFGLTFSFRDPDGYVVTVHDRP